MTDVSEAKLHLPLTYHEARAVRSALVAKARKFDRAAAKGDFVPEPGKIDRNRQGAAMNGAIAERLDALLTIAIEDLKTERSVARRVYELVNPSDAISFVATPFEASCIAHRMKASHYLVTDAETGQHVDPAEDPEFSRKYDDLWKSAEAIQSYSKAWASFMCFPAKGRDVLEKALAWGSAAEAEEIRRTLSERNRSSMNDICKVCRDAAVKIAATRPDQDAHTDGAIAVNASASTGEYPDPGMDR